MRSFLPLRASFSLALVASVGLLAACGGQVDGSSSGAGTTSTGANGSTDSDDTSGTSGTKTTTSTTTTTTTTTAPPWSGGGCCADAGTSTPPVGTTTPGDGSQEARFLSYVDTLTSLDFTSLGAITSTENVAPLNLHINDAAAVQALYRASLEQVRLPADTMVSCVAVDDNRYTLTFNDAQGAVLTLSVRPSGNCQWLQSDMLTDTLETADGFWTQLTVTLGPLDPPVYPYPPATPDAGH